MAVLDELLLLRKLTQAAGGDFDQGWIFVVLQHTDCGILRMQGERARLAMPARAASALNVLT